MIYKYIRLYADRDGESHFEDVEITFQEMDFVPPAPPVLLSPFEPANQYGFEVVPPGYHGDWHPAPSRVLAIYLSGEGTIEASDGEVRRIRPGTILLAEDTTGKGHISRNTGSSEALVAILQLPD
jgi:quercetin dioxygenase-like cupin family protein